METPRPKKTRPAGPRSPYELMRALGEVDPSNGEALLELLSQARANGVSLDLDLASGQDSVASRDPQWLLAWCSDADGCDFSAIAESALDEGRRADLEAVAGLCFASSADATPEQLGAAIRLIAARTFVGNRSPDELASELFEGWRDELYGGEARAGIQSADDLRPHLGWLVHVGLRDRGQLRHGFTKVIAVNRAM